MRNLLDSASFCNSLDSIAEEFARDFPSSTAIIDSPNFLENFLTNLILPRELDDLICLSILHWYIKDERVQLYLRLELERVSYFTENFIVRLLLESKAEMKMFLLESTLWSSRSFFGNLFTLVRVRKLNKIIQFKKRSRRVRYPQVKRGYDDKGSKRESHQWKPSSDWSLNELQEKIEQKRSSLVSTSQFARGMLR
jgi:hypothetical protein